MQQRLTLEEQQAIAAFRQMDEYERGLVLYWVDNLDRQLFAWFNSVCNDANSGIRSAGTQRENQALFVFG